MSATTTKKGHQHLRQYNGMRLRSKNPGSAYAVGVTMAASVSYCSDLPATLSL